MSQAFIDPPNRFPFWLRLGVWMARRVTGKDLLIARLLAWYPRAALGSGALESLVAHHDGRLTERVLQVVRIAASQAVACPFCIDMNSYGAEERGINAQEMEALRGHVSLEDVPSFSTLEIVAIRYARLVSQTPLKFMPDFVAELTSVFSEREIVILASTAAQVNYWARLIQALGAPPAGFTTMK